MSDALIEIHINMQGRVIMRYAGGKCVDVTDTRGRKLYSASATEALQSGEPVVFTCHGNNGRAISFST